MTMLVMIGIIVMMMMGVMMLIAMTSTQMIGF